MAALAARAAAIVRDVSRPTAPVRSKLPHGLDHCRERLGLVPNGRDHRRTAGTAMDQLALAALATRPALGGILAFAPDDRSRREAQTFSGQRADGGPVLQAIKNAWNARRRRPAAPAEVQPPQTADPAAAQPPPAGLWSRLKTVALSAASIPAIAGAGIAAFPLLSQTLDPKSVVTLKVHEPPEVWQKAGFGQASLEARLAGELGHQLRTMTLPLALPGGGNLPAGLTQLEADAKIEVRGTDVFLRPVSAKLRKWLGREDVDIEVYITLAREQPASGELGDEGFLFRVVSSLNDKSAITHNFTRGIDASLVTFAYDQLEPTVAEVVTPLMRVAARSRSLLTCRQPGCTALVSELRTAARLAEVSPPSWDDKHAQLLSIQFDMFREMLATSGPAMWSRPASATPRSLARLTETVRRLNDAVARRPDDPSLLSHASTLALVTGDQALSASLADSALRAYAKNQGLASDDSALCTEGPGAAWSQRGPAAQERVSTLGVLCLESVIYKIPHPDGPDHVKAVGNARQDMRQVLRWGGSAPGVTAFAALLWRRIDEREAMSLLRQASLADKGSTSSTAYGLQLLEADKPWAALRAFSRALRHTRANEPDDFLLQHVLETSGTLGLAAVQRAADACLGMLPMDRLACREDIVELLDAAPREHRTVPGPRRPIGRRSA